MARYRSSRVLPTILTIFVIIIAIAGLVALANLIFSGSSSTAPAQVNVSKEALLNSSADRSVSMTVRGPIVADEDFRSYRITVSPSSRVIQTYNGYLGSVIDSQVLPNNTAAYEEFIHALEKANFAVGVPFDEADNDVRGICAVGTVHEFSTLDKDETQTMLWTSSCKGSPGSLKASTAQLSQLFLNQIPDGSAITRTLRL